MSEPQGYGYDDDDTLSKAIDAAYHGSGVTDEKKDAAEDVKQDADNAETPTEANPDSDWKKPIVEVYEDFTKWVDKWTEVMKYRREAGKDRLAYDWYKSGSDISILDREDYRKKLFDTDGIQNKYRGYLSALFGVNGDPVCMKFQSGNIQADERAFYIRHATIPRLMSTGIMQNIQYDFLKEVYLNRIEKFREYEDDNRKQFFEPMYKGDAEGKNTRSLAYITAKAALGLWGALFLP